MANAQNRRPPSHRSEATKARILSVAAETFATRGYHATSLEDVAAELGLRRQAIYHYFPSKIDILVSLNHQLLDLFQVRATAVVRGSPQAPDLFVALLRTHVLSVAEHFPLVDIFIKESRSVPDAERAQLNRRRSVYVGTFVSAYEAGVAAGVLRDIDPLLAVNFVLAAANNMRQWHTPKRGLRPDTIAELTVELLRSGFCVAPSAAS